MFKPEPEPNWRSMYYDLKQELELMKDRYKELQGDYNVLLLRFKAKRHT